MLQQLFNVNWLAILVTGIVFMVVGFVWYTALGKPWSAYTGWTQEKVASLPQSQMTTSYVITFITALVTAFVLANFLKLAGAADIGAGLVVAILTWIGFVAAPTISNFAFEHRPWGLWAINFGNTLANLLIGSVILTLWK